MAGVDEEDLVKARGFLLAAVEEPEGARKRHRVEHVRADGDDSVNGVVLDQLAAKLLFRGPGV